MSGNKLNFDILFPAGQPNFHKPFSVDVDGDNVVHIRDADGYFLCSFCQFTQMPLDDEEGLAREVAYWTEQANMICVALNRAYPSPQT